MNGQSGRISQHYGNSLLLQSESAKNKISVRISRAPKYPSSRQSGRNNFVRSSSQSLARKDMA